MTFKIEKMKKEEVLKNLEEKVISYLKDTLGEEQFPKSLEDNVISYLRGTVQMDELLEGDEIDAAYTIAEDFVNGFWYAVELFGIDIEEDWKFAAILRQGFRRPRWIIRN